MTSKRYLWIIGACMGMSVSAYDVVDMADRNVTIGKTIQKVYAPSPYGSYALYAMAPSMMSGWVMSIADKNKPYLDPIARDLPVLGSISGQGQTSAIESMLSQKPDLILMWSASPVSPLSQTNQKLEQLTVPYVYAVAEDMNAYPAVFRFLGEVLDKKERGEMLASRMQTVLDEVKTAVDKATYKPKVYYAEGTDGLSTECDDSIHVQILKLLGNVNVHQCHTSNHKGFEKVTLEQILLYDPDVIITPEELFWNGVQTHPQWKEVRAVREGRVYLIPTTPFNWFDRPPSFMRFIGLQWLANLLYPNEYPIDIKEETKRFYADFMHVSLDDASLNVILSPKSLVKKKESYVNF